MNNNDVTSPKKQRSCRLSGSSENRAFERCRSSGCLTCKSDFSTEVRLQGKAEPPG